MENPFKQIFKFNKEAGLLDAGYNSLREPAFLIEEALEGFENLDLLADKLNMQSVYHPEAVEMYNPKEISRWIVSTAMTGNGNYKESDWESTDELTDVEKLDKHLDAIVYSAGAIFKLGLSPQQLEQSLNIVMNANMKKLGAPKDSEGKQLKPENWEQYAPEPKLQAIIDKVRQNSTQYSN